MLTADSRVIDREFTWVVLFGPLKTTPPFVSTAEMVRSVVLFWAGRVNVRTAPPRLMAPPADPVIVPRKELPAAPVLFR